MCQHHAIFAQSKDDNLDVTWECSEGVCRSALLVAQHPKVAVSALMKLAGGAPSFAHELNVDAFLDQARSYDEATASLLGNFLESSQNRYLSHPLPVMRAREIDRWAQSAQYRNLMARNAPR
jgi:Zn-dependent protease with chaperone function